MVQAAHPRLKALPINFVGNVEGKEIPSGEVDVVVCDGFAGNVVLKLAEGLAGAITGMIREEISASLVSKLFAVGVLPAFRRVRRRLDYAEYGGAPLIGLDGVAIIAHGGSNPRAIKNAIRAARDAAAQEINRHIAEALSEIDSASGLKKEGLPRKLWERFKSKIEALGEKTESASPTEERGKE